MLRRLRAAFIITGVFLGVFVAVCYLALRTLPEKTFLAEFDYRFLAAFVIAWLFRSAAEERFKPKPREEID